MKYQYLGEDDNVFRVKHPDGSELHIAKKAVGPDVHKRIKSLEPLNMAEGGIVPELEDAGYSSEPTDEDVIESLSKENPLKDYDNLLTHYKDAGVSGISGGPETRAEADFNQLKELRAADPSSLSVYQAGRLQELESIAAGSLPTPAPVSTPAPAAQGPAPAQVAGPMLPGPASAPAPIAVPTATDPYASYLKPFDQMAHGAKMAADAQASGFNQQAQMYEKTAQELQRIDAEKEQALAPLRKRSDDLYNATLNGTIDSNRLWHNMGTGNKVLASISVLLSGLGAGMQGPGAKNMALDVLEKAIDRDIDSQKAELGKKQTLFSENLRVIGDVNSAYAATKANYLAVAEANMKAIAARTNSVEAKSRAEIYSAQLGLARQKHMADVGKDYIQKRAFSGYGITDIEAQVLPEEARKRLVRTGDKYVGVLDEHRAKKATDVITDYEGVMGNLNELMELRNKNGPETLPGPIKTKMDTLATNIRLALKEQKKLGTLDKGSQEVLDKLVADPTGFNFASSSYQALKESLTRETQSTLNTLGIKDTSFMGAHTGPKFKTVKGIKYMRGPNGEPIRVN